MARPHKNSIGGGGRTSGAFFNREEEKEVEELLREFGVAIAKKPIRRALRESQKLITTEAKARAPVGATGDLKRAIKTRALKGRGRAGRKQIATATSLGQQHLGGTTYYGAFVELGTKRMVGRGFLKAAFDSKEDEAVRKFSRVLSEAIAFMWLQGGKLTGFKAGN
jgi:HK97 gp10 family phage protein